MANIKSQIKRNRQNEARRVRNRSVRTALKTEGKKVRGAASDAAAGTNENAAEQFRRAARAMDKAVSKGVLHKRTAARRKSRLARAVSAGGGSLSG